MRNTKNEKTKQCEDYGKKILVLSTAIAIELYNQFTDEQLLILIQLFNNMATQIQTLIDFRAFCEGEPIPDNEVDIN